MSLFFSVFCEDTITPVAGVHGSLGQPSSLLHQLQPIEVNSFSPKQTNAYPPSADAKKYFDASSVNADDDAQRICCKSQLANSKLYHLRHEPEHLVDFHAD